MPFQKRDLFRLQDPGPDFEITCAGKGYAWCHWILPGYKTNCPTEIRRLIFRLRRRVETLFSQFGGQLSAEKCFRKASGDYVCIRLENQVPEYNLCMAFSGIFWSSCDIGKIKQLIFWKFVLPKSGRDFTAFIKLCSFNYKQRFFKFIIPTSHLSDKHLTSHPALKTSYLNFFLKKLHFFVRFRCHNRLYTIST